jgi:hypothetical protein
MSKFTDNLWTDLVQEHGATLAHADRPEPGRARRPRRRVLAGSTLALAGAGAALALTLSATASTPAYAVTRQHDGSVSVKISSWSGIAGANRELAKMGVHERVLAVADGQPDPQDCVAPGTGSGGWHLLIAGKPKDSTGKGSTSSGDTGSGDTVSGNTGTDKTGSGKGSPWHVVACPSSGSTGSTGSGNTGAG